MNCLITSKIMAEQPEDGANTNDRDHADMFTNNESLNGPITDAEILNVIKRAKLNKAVGLDSICNEYIKSTSDFMVPLYTKIVNVILDTGVLLILKIIPIYKNKGSLDYPNNYRDITILSCLGKIFTAILNSRLAETEYLSESSRFPKILQHC